MRKFFLGLLLAEFLFSSSFAQNYAVYNSYYVNPFLYNPAEAASEYTWIFVNHRQQWMKVDGAPVLTTFNAHTLLNETHAGIGIKASSYKRGILNTTDFSLSYAYGVPLNKTNILFFGLSGGGISNSIEVSEAYANDPAIANYLVNNIQPAANFGMLYRSASGLNFGVALPQLFGPKFNSPTSFETSTFSPINEVVVSAYFKRKVEGKIVSRSRKGVRSKVKTKDSNAPLELYTLYKYSKLGTSQFEVMAKLNVSQNLWLGGAYRQDYGWWATAGLHFNAFLLAYSYEPGNQPDPAFSLGSHEIQLGLRIGEVRKFRRQAPLLRSTLRVQQEQKHSARFQHKEEDPDEIHNQKKQTKKYYVVIRAFADFGAADTYKKKLIEQKYNANVLYHEKDKKYYVHVFETTKASEGHEEVRNLKNYSKLKEAKLLTVTSEE